MCNKSRKLFNECYSSKENIHNKSVRKTLFYKNYSYLTKRDERKNFYFNALFLYSSSYTDVVVVEKEIRAKRKLFGFRIHKFSV